MQKNVYNVNVAKTPDIFRADMKVTQNDKDSNEIVVRIFNDDGSEIDYAQFSSASIIFTKPDYHTVQSNPERLTHSSNGIKYIMGTNDDFLFLSGKAGHVDLYWAASTYILARAE